MLIAEQVAWHRLDAEPLALHTVEAYEVEWPALEAEAVTVRRGVRLAATCRARCTIAASRVRSVAGLECAATSPTRVRAQRVANAAIACEATSETAIVGSVVRNAVLAAECVATTSLKPTAMRSARLRCTARSTTALNGRKIKYADIACHARCRTSIKAQRMRSVESGLECVATSSTALAPSRVVSIAAGAANATATATTSITATRVRSRRISAAGKCYLNPVLRSDRKPLFDSAGRRIFRKSRIFEIYTP